MLIYEQIDQQITDRGTLCRETPIPEITPNDRQFKGHGHLRVSYNGLPTQRDSLGFSIKDSTFYFSCKHLSEVKPVVT